MTSNIVLSDPSKNYKVVGTRPVRHDGYDKVTGKALYGGDMNLPGMTFGKVLRSPHAHAIIKSIDTSKAEALPGVRAVITAADFPEPPSGSRVIVSGPPINLKFMSSNILARDKVLYKGHPVAAVTATSQHIAEEALSLIEVEYEVLPSVSDVHEALAQGAPQLFPEYKNNISGYNKTTLGDIDAGFASADIVIEREFNTKTVHQGYIEPHAATGLWNTDGRITVWGSSQGHFQVRDRTATVLGIDASKVKVVPMEIGGGFGGKTTIYLEPLVAVLSRKSKTPVRISMSRAEVLEATGPTSGGYMKIKIGATNDGKIVAAQALLQFEAGGYPGSPVNAAAACLFSPYNIANVVIDAYDVVDNKPKTTAYRAPGAPIGAYGVESVVDEIAEKLGMDPLDFRIANAAKEGTRRANGIVNPVIGCIETAQAARDHEHYKTPLNGKYRGRGVASGFWMNGSGAACATANVHYDGTVSLTIGSMDIGGSRPASAQQFAEVLGIPVEDVYPQVGDTDSIGYTSMTGGSGVAFKTGWASYEAGQDVKTQMIGRAALLWETSEDQIELVNGMFQHKSDPELKMSFKELASRLPECGGPVVGSANMDPVGAGPGFATHIVDVEVDPDTGKVEILRYTAVQDAGKAIHPSYVEGQLQGGAAQGIGWALNEEYYMSDDGKMVNATFLDYRMPTSLDLPMIDTVIVEVANPSHPYGVRGVGEVCVVPPLAAVSNAIYHATGVRMRSLPMNPIAVLKALQEG